MSGKRIILTVVLLVLLFILLFIYADPVESAVQITRDYMQTMIGKLGIVCVGCHGIT